jgi:hypothetical protein
MNNELLPSSSVKALRLLDVLSSSGFDLNIAFSRFCTTGRPRKLSFDNLLECLSLRVKYSCENWKGLYFCLLECRSSWSFPSYSNFLLNMKSLLFFLLDLLDLILFLNRLEFFERKDRIAFTDSTPLPVCKIIRSSRHKTMLGLAKYSKSTTGWYYGFKLHVTIDYLTSKPMYIQLSQSTLDDRQVLAKQMKSKTFINSGTMFVADKGYQAAWLEQLAYKTGNYLLTGKRKSKSMKILASRFDIHLLHTRAKIESFFSKLKQNNFITSTRSRSKLGYLFTYISSIFTMVTKKT